MSQPYDICVRGAGIVGRALALLLAREKLRVALLARPTPPDSAPDVRAYALNAASRELLDGLRCWPGEQHATPVRNMEVYGDGDGHVRFSAAVQGVPALAWIADVPALEALLAEAVRYQPGLDLVAAPAAAALTVVCEGRASTTRAEFGVDFMTRRYPQRAIALRLATEWPHNQVAWQWFTEGEILAFLPLDGPRGSSVAVVWSVPEEHVENRLALDAQALVAQLEAASHHKLGRLALISERAAWPLQLARASRWVGRQDGAAWALAGDAAHAAHPLAGQGLNLGLGDVAALARVLREREHWRGVGDGRLLRRYERARQFDMLSMGLVTDGLQQLFSRAGAPWQALRNWGMRGFEHSGPLKNWVARQAMGLR